MNSREKILMTLQANKTSSEVDLPPLPSYHQVLSLEDSLAQFKQNLQTNKALVFEYTTEDQVSNLIKNQWPDGTKVYAPMFPHLHNSTADQNSISRLDIAVVKGTLGVINNGAIWVKAKDLEQRSIPFITRFLVVLLEAANLVSDLHEAYRQLDPNEVDYGVWISGPSKTGDIEQALVIGAHGALEMMVLINR